MSLRYTSRVAYQAGMRAAQVMKEGVPKTLKDSASACGSSSSRQQQARKFSAVGALDSTSATIHKAAAACDNKFKQAEESLRTVLFLSCWGPN